MRHSASLVMLMLPLALTGAPAFSQSLYDEELSQLSGTVRALMVRAERVQPRDEADRIAIKQELFELSKKLHRLEMADQRVGQFLRIVTEEMLRRQPSVEPDHRESLDRLGWNLHEGHLVEVTLMKQRDLLPHDAAWLSVRS